MTWRVTREPALTDDAARLLATVPEWFGLPEATQSYVAETKTLENWEILSPRNRRNDRHERGVQPAHCYVHTMGNVVHHIELWTADVQASAPSFDWLLGCLGWVAGHDPNWPQGRIWHHTSGVYLVLEQSPDVTGHHERTNAGLNHLALRVDNLTQLDELRRECPDHGWLELYADRYPHAGGPDHTALFIENDEGFEFELVAE